MLDLVKLTLTAGDGGDGRVSFRREKYVPKGGPDGGKGGDGGSVVLRGAKQLATLRHLAGVDRVTAEAGQMGGKRQKTGKKGQDVLVEVPLGTVVWQFGDSDDDFKRLDLKKTTIQNIPKTKLIEITTNGQEVVACQGGKGGRGNVAFKGPANTTPQQSEQGTPGEQQLVILELKMLAEVGLVGFPNAGKSTLLSRLTKAHPKIASYPFTTLQPELGVWQLGSSKASKSGKGDRPSKEVVIADIPGLVEGASQGTGLGYAFLKHIEACRVLVLLLALDEAQVFDTSLSDQQKAKHLFDQLQTLRQELRTYHPDLINKPSIIVINKSDLYSPALTKAMAAQARAQQLQQPIVISAATGEGMSALEQAVIELLNRESSLTPPPPTKNPA